jgi:ubiquinone/menaquinone biosynthesis C-methylase UbiE
LAKTTRFDDRTTSRRNAIHIIERTVVTTFFSETPSEALTPTQAESQYDTYASKYDHLDGGRISSILGIEPARRDLLKQARGNILEIGVGTGLNLDKYDGQQVSSLTLVDVSSAMLQQAAARVRTLPNLRNVKVNFVKADATTELVDRFGSESFDSVVDSFSLCVMGNEGARKCLDQMSQVVKRDGGQLLLLENSRSSNPMLGLYQDATADAAAATGGKGCVYNQDVGALIRSNGRLDVQEESSYSAGLFRAFRCIRK